MTLEKRGYGNIYYRLRNRSSLLKTRIPWDCYQVCSNTLLFDSGSGTLRRLLEAGIDFKEVDYLIYSHFHPDHTADLCRFSLLPTTEVKK